MTNLQKIQHRACDDCQFEGGDHQTGCKHYVPTKWDIEKGKAVPVSVSTTKFKLKGIPKNDAIYIEQLEERIQALEDWKYNVEDQLI